MNSQTATITDIGYSPVSSSPGEYLEYDRNSNIMSLERVYAGEPVQDAAMSYIGNHWSNFAGLGWHDNIARWHDAILNRLATPAPPKS